MTILTDKDIHAFLNKNQLINNWDQSCISTCSYDLRIGTIFHNGQIINAAHSKADEPITIKPGEVVTMLTLEEVALPSDIAGTAYAMNGQSCEGFLVLNPGHIDPGYEGPLSIKALNMRKVELCLCRKEKIFTIVFQKLNEPVEHPYQNTLDRADRELKLHKSDIERSMRSLADLIALNSPFLTAEQINKAILSHWSTKFHNVLVLVAALASCLAVYMAYKDPGKTTSSPSINITTNVPLTQPNAINATKPTGQSEVSEGAKKD